MAGLTATQLAEELTLSKGRISQMVKAGTLNGCFTGEGRQRRFDLAKAAAVIGRKLDPGQMLGNGAKTQVAAKKALAEFSLQDLDDGEKRQAAGGATKLNDDDPSRYEMARTQRAEELARRERRNNLVDEGLFVLASEVETQVRRQIGQEIAAFETSVIRDGARNIADQLGVDYKKARQILRMVWREYRSGRKDVKADEAKMATLSEVENEMNF